MSGCSRRDRCIGWFPGQGVGVSVGLAQCALRGIAMGRRGRAAWFTTEAKRVESRALWSPIMTEDVQCQVRPQ